MTKDTVEAAIKEAERFIKRAKAIRWSKSPISAITYPDGNKETAAARRASLDLTRALADMRKY